MKIERLLIPGAVGKLEALLEWDPAARAPGVTLVCHPHPLYGGTMHTKAVFRAAKAAIDLGIPTLRFNFRGVGKSEGQFGGGIGERDDVRAALDYLGERFPGQPVSLAGFSFGSWVGLVVGASDDRVRTLVGLGIPVGSTDFRFLRPVTKPKLIVQGTEDVYGPREKVEHLFASLAEPKQIHWVRGSDHFFTGRLDELQTAVREFLASHGRPGEKESWSENNQPRDSALQK